MKRDLLTAIREKMPDFSKSQKRIGEYIIHHYEKAAFMTAQKLGKAVSVSESTVVRFAIEMGYEGYPELQKSLQALIRNRLTAMQRLEVTNDRIGEQDILKNVLTQDMDRIRDTITMNSNDNFTKAVDKICEADTVYILGAMSSNVVARFLDSCLSLILPKVHFIHAVSTSGIYQQLIRINKNDIFIAISFPRYSKSTLNAAAYAKDCGADILAITDSPNSPLAQYADLLLLAKSDMAGFADSLAAPMSLINALVVALSIRKKDDLAVTLDRLEVLWDENNVYNKDS